MHYKTVPAVKYHFTKTYTIILIWVVTCMLLYTCPLTAVSQITNIRAIDSLKHVLKSQALPADTNRVKTLCALATAEYVVDYNEGLNYAAEALSLAEKLTWKEGIGLANNALGRNYWAKSDYLQCLACCQKALEIFGQTGDVYNTILALRNIGSVNYAESHYDKALEYFNKALKIAETNNDTAVKALIYSEYGIANFIASTYASKSDFKNAIAFCNRAVIANEKDGNEFEVGRILPTMASFEYLLKNYGEGEKQVNRALFICKKYADRTGQGKCYEILGWMKMVRQDYAGAIACYNNAVNDFMYANDKGHVARNYASLGQTYLSMAGLPAKKIVPGNETTAGYNVHELLANAAANLEKAVSIGLSINSWISLQGYEKDLANIYELQGNYAKAVDALKQYDIFKDSLFNKDSQKKFTEQLLQYEYDKQKDSLNYVNKLQQTQLNILEKENEVSQLKQRRQLLYSITGIAALGLLASVFIFRNRLQRLRLKNELAKEKSDKLLKEAEFKSRMNDITFSALRSQMDPHFIFNCLNSIKLYTEQNNNEAASAYLTKFSKLIRSILDSARSDNITLASEVQLLKLYLEMEAMRFKEKLKYFVNIEENTDADFIDIPPLLIQPYVENAIWHGLMHKEEGGMIKIDISMQHDGLLIITIEDNGIGRVKSAALKSKTAVQHKSFGTKLTAERIALINEKYKTSAQIITTDLYDSDNNACGTMVTIKLPVK